jgi:fatty-acyl-CoA synthase
MEVPLTPMEFARRARRLYGSREALVDGNLRLTYEQTSGDLCVIDDTGNEVPHDGETLGEIIRKPLRKRFAVVGCIRAMPPSSIPMDMLKFVIESKTSSSAAAKTFLPWKSSVIFCAILQYKRSQWSDYHEKWGEAPCASFVVLRSGMTATELELREFARNKMAHFKVPQDFRFIAELPKTATGKIQKYVLRGRKSAISIQ